ncbi:GGDEF domain-containing protein [Desulforamulus aquiferis]|uniref:GGDEF domain-containing protein n=1 Tax=Desulforamulus aquiferis TaxID=1397668 RepID=A0AAW7ZCF4_9FIRM|nr:GGDEF domain-containing protein [Desulforamulus aquiferis]
MDFIIGRFRIAIALFIILVELYQGNTNYISIAGYVLLFLYSCLWLLFQTANSSPQMGTWGYLHLSIDLLLMSTFTLLNSKVTTSYHDGLYIILVLIYLMRFGKKVAIVFSLFASAVIFFVCFSKHFEHNIAHYILIGTLLTIIYFVGNIMDMEKSHREKLAFLSTHDELTGVYNFRHFQNLSVFEIDRVNRFQKPLSLALFDIDDFKSFNDNFGHDAGNLVLKTVAKLIREQIKETDILARFGGEEFVLLMPETDKTSAINLAENIIKVISQHNFPNQRVTISAGLAVYSQEATTANKLFKLADDFLYQSKREGKNCVRY